MTCSIDGCDGVVKTRGLCAKHYKRWQRHGDALYEPPGPVERFWGKVDKNAAGSCWEWVGARFRNGYGHSAGGGSCLAHRFAYELLIGPIPDGLTLDHLCRNKACVNPAHLEAVTQRQNTLRGTSPAARNATATQCIHGHALDEANTYIYADGVST